MYPDGSPYEGAHVDCPCCRFEFGVDDWAHDFAYWRAEWVARGMPFYRESRRPAEWDPCVALETLSQLDPVRANFLYRPDRGFYLPRATERVAPGAAAALMIESLVVEADSLTIDYVTREAPSLHGLWVGIETEVMNLRLIMTELNGRRTWPSWSHEGYLPEGFLLPREDEVQRFLAKEKFTSGPRHFEGP